LDEGHSVARQLGYDGNECFTSFSPTNVRLHQVGILLNLGDGAGAVSVARQVIPDGLSRLPKERRASYHLALARGHSLAGHRDDAIDTLLAAESLFLDEVRCRSIAIDLLDGGVVRQVRAHGSWNSSPHELDSRIMPDRRLLRVAAAVGLPCVVMDTSRCGTHHRHPIPLCSMPTR
jgi:hypothetical protein